ncbi:protein IQ-DOMAIN 32-like isoform X2 [Phalaenopsis equestris]|uniref:protein IQ-DOMAIN 32-like isoform X2 n=1 Tax=Phalaenopsis equestris TaxID=78828 RepID=UPI0009E36007|nr:protein IQ-DOMAIN 32-like isoform X2 [Phalaenopsis equestris]
MAKSKGSCFHIMACACGESASSDELILRESKASSDKSRWSFRKRVSSPRVLKKASSQTNPSKEEFPTEPSLSSTIVNSKVSATVITRNGSNNDKNILESAAIIIQSAIRGCLGVRKLEEVKNVIKLQAAIRGHLVRTRAVGTLHCIRAITKMQAIFRARFASQLQEKDAGTLVTKLESSRSGLYTLGKGTFCEGTKSFYSSKKLLSNRFVQQMLASTPKTRPINTKCDPSKLDEVWKWLERWTAIITSQTEEESHQHLKKNLSANSKSGLSELSAASESKADLNARSTSNLRIRSTVCLSDSCISSIENNEESDIEIKEASKQSDSFSAQLALKTDDYSSNKNESRGNNMNNHSKKEQYGPSETEARKSAIWSRRSSNPTFAAAQSKFEELTSNSKNVKCNSSSSFAHQDCAADSIIQVAASECGTEISISSTLDSPDRSETECGEIILEIGSIDKHNYDADKCSDNLFIIANKGAESQASESNKLEEAVICASLSSKAPDMAPPANFQLDVTSVEGTPKSHHTILEAYGTPSSEISVNVGSRSKGSNTPSQKQSFTGSGSKLASTASTAKLSLNGSKNGKRRQSTGMSGTDLEDEPRMSNSNSNSLPSYMQATKSARAKIHANNSPKSSPDLQDKNNHIKKRHSLPIGNVKQDSSPPKLRAQQNAKSNGMHGPHNNERRWQR